MPVAAEAAQAIPINQAEAVLLPLFCPSLHDVSQWTLECEDGYAVWEQAGDCCAVRGQARTLRLSWQGELSLAGYDALRLFTSYPPEAVLSGWAVCNGQRQCLFEGLPGDIVPQEPTSGSLPVAFGERIVTELELELGFPSRADVTWNLYWIGAVDLAREPELDPPLPHPSNWQGLLDQGGGAALVNPWIASSEGLQSWKRKAGTPEFAALRQRLAESAAKWEAYRPEDHLREYLPVEEHLYRYARVRDRGRPLWDEPMMLLALAGYLCDEPRWTQLAARFLLCMAHTPNWYEGPQGGVPGSTWHHVCFVESHNLHAAAFALQFVGDALTPVGRRMVWDRLEEVWPLINRTCQVPGYRWFMNQGLVFNAMRLAGAAALWREGRGEEYARWIERSYLDHCTVLDRYLAPDGHCCEGPHYFAYSMTKSIPAWIAYAAFRNAPVSDILPLRFRRADGYLRLVTSTLEDGDVHVPMNASMLEPWPSGLLALLAAANRRPYSSGLLQRRQEDGWSVGELSAWDALVVLALDWQDKAPAAPPASVLTDCVTSGLGAIRWQQPRPGQLIFAAERPSTGHHHLDRGSLILEANGKALLIDPGMTNYSYSRCMTMREPDWHNLARPLGLAMRCHNRPEEWEAFYPCAELQLHQTSEWGYEFTIDLAPIYGGEVVMGVRRGRLRLMPARQRAHLTVEDEWRLNSPASIEVYWQSAQAWEMSPEDGGHAACGDLRLTCRDLCGGLLARKLLANRLDWAFRRFFTVEFLTQPALHTILRTEMEFQI